MEWQFVLLIFMSCLLALMLLGVPVVFAFWLIIIGGIFFLWGGERGLVAMTTNLTGALLTFPLLAVPMFILMSEIMFRTQLAPNMIDALDMWLGRLPGRLGFLAVGAGTLMSTFTGSSMASTAMLGSTLLPQMEGRGYKEPMSLGPILGSGGLAIMIPPSTLGVILGSVSEISIAGILIGIIMPGLLMAVLYGSYILIRSKLQPHLAPLYIAPPVPISKKVGATARYILPLAFLIFLVTGLIFLGVATPTEAAATGAFGALILAAVYRKLNLRVLKEAFVNTFSISVQMLIIITGAVVFGQIIGFTGAGRGLAAFATSLPLSPILIFVAMQFTALFLGMFLAAFPMMMIAVPMFMPVIRTLGFDPVWFAVIFLLNMEMAGVSPPVGMSLFAMKGVAPQYSMGAIYKAAIPFWFCDLLAMILLIAFPSIVLWLPGMMG